MLFEYLKTYKAQIFNRGQSAKVFKEAHDKNAAICVIKNSEPYVAFPLDEDIVGPEGDLKKLLSDQENAISYSKAGKLDNLWRSLLNKSIVCLRYFDTRELMWNVFPFHPYKEGKRASNRTPTQRELEEGLKYIDALKTIFQINDSQVFAVGKKAKLLLGLTEDNHCIRHPANDYKKEFRPQFDLKIGQLYLHNQFVR